MSQPQPVATKAHIALHVRDLARSIDFYSKLCDAERVRVRRDYAKLDRAAHALNFTLNELPAHAAPASSSSELRSLSHLGIQVASTNEVLAMRERWRRAGLDTRDEMKVECCYASQDKTWVRDPDGNEWEVFVIPDDHLPAKPPEPYTSACCE